MNRLPIVLSVVAVLGSMLSAGLYFEIGNSKKILEMRLNDANARASRLEVDLGSAKEQTGALQSSMAALASERDTLQLKSAKAETQLLERDRDLVQIKNVLSVYELTAQALANELSALRTDLDDARHSNASPEAVAGYKNTIAELERQLANARDGAALPTIAGAATAVFASRIGRATVMTVGPQSSFVVLNFGSLRGARLGQRFHVNQGTEVVATALISDVRDNFSIAQVLPETLRGALQKGDSAILVR